MNVADQSFDAQSVVAFIYDPRNARRIIWSPGTTLEAMGIEYYPHHPPRLYRTMKRVLEGLCAEGHLVKRQRLHSHYSMKEIAYERSDEDHAGVGW